MPRTGRVGKSTQFFDFFVQAYLHTNFMRIRNGGREGPGAAGTTVALPYFVARQ